MNKTLEVLQGIVHGVKLNLALAGTNHLVSGSGA